MFEVTPTDEDKKTLLALLRIEEGLSRWEVNFIEQLWKSIHLGWSKRQYSKLQQIADDRL